MKPMMIFLATFLTFGVASASQTANFKNCDGGARAKVSLSDSNVLSVEVRSARNGLVFKGSGVVSQSNSNDLTDNMSFFTSHEGGLEIVTGLVPKKGWFSKGYDKVTTILDGKGNAVAHCKHEI